MNAILDFARFLSSGCFVGDLWFILGGFAWWFVLGVLCRGFYEGGGGGGGCLGGYLFRGVLSGGGGGVCPEVLSWGVLPGGFCPGFFFPRGGFVHRGVLSSGVLSGGFCPGGFVQGGFVLESFKYKVIEVASSHILNNFSKIAILGEMCDC